MTTSSAPAKTTWWYSLTSPGWHDPVHVHKWAGVSVVRRLTKDATAGDYVIQSCECGEVRRVEVPR